MNWHNAPAGPSEFMKIAGTIPCLTREDREDLCSETALRLCHMRVRKGKTKWPLARAIARNLARDLSKHRNCRAHPGPLEPWHENIPDNAMADPPEDMDGIKRRLPRIHQEAIRAIFFDGLQWEAAAKKLRIPTGTLKSRVSRAIEKMREHINQ